MPNLPNAKSRCPEAFRPLAGRGPERGGAPLRAPVAAHAPITRRPICARPTSFSMPSTTTSITTIKTVE